MPRIIAVILFCVLMLPAHSQKVGLVLSGGGAKGLAHIAIIQMLEENNIPIDYIAGTSIGAIVGCLYASGYTPAEILELFKSEEFKLWSQGRNNKDNLFYFKRKDNHPDWLKLDVAKKEDKFKMILPLNLVPERQMDFAFMQITAQSTAACDQDFNKLMVPFRCVSTDIYNNKAVIHKDGDLGEAVRASMTFPLVYKPIEKNGSLLFDGGIINNFPVDVMIDDFNPDFIIGHKVVSDDIKPDPEDLFGQIEAMIMQNTKYAVPDSLGILLETKLTDVALFDFEKVVYIYKRGLETANIYKDSIAKRIERRESNEAIKEKRDAYTSRLPELRFNNIQVEGVKNNMQRKYIIQSIKAKKKQLTIEELNASYFKLLSDEHIKSIRPIARYNKKTELFDVHMKVEPRKPIDLELGGHISTRSNTFGYVGVNYKTFMNRSYTATINGYLGRFYSSVLAGGRIDFPSQNPVYISLYGTWHKWNYSNISSDWIYTDLKPTNNLQEEVNFRIEGGFPYNRFGVIDFGISYSYSRDEYRQVSEFVQGDTPDVTTFNPISAHVRFDRKKYNFRQYPTDGSRRMAVVRVVNGTEQYNPGTTAPYANKYSNDHSYVELHGLIDQYYSINQRFTIGGLAELIYNNKKLLSNYTSTQMGAKAFHPTPNSSSMYLNSYRANQFIAAGIKAIYNLNQTFHLRTELYGFTQFKDIYANELNLPYYNDSYFTRFSAMGVTALVAQTRFGPISAEVNYYDKPGAKYYFSINMGYMLFNKRGY